MQSAGVATRPLLVGKISTFVSIRSKQCQKTMHQHRLVPTNTRIRVVASAAPAVKPEAEIDQMPAFLDSLKWDKNGLVVAIAQHVDTGEVLMQAFADRAAICETMQTG